MISVIRHVIVGVAFVGAYVGLRRAVVNAVEVEFAKPEMRAAMAEARAAQEVFLNVH